MFFGCTSDVVRRYFGSSTGVLLGVGPDVVPDEYGDTTGSSTGVLLGVVPDVVPDEHGSSTDVSRLVLFTSLCVALCLWVMWSKSCGT